MLAYSMTVEALARIVPPSPRHLDGVGENGQNPLDFRSEATRRQSTLRLLLDRRRTLADIRDTKRPEGIGRLQHLKAGIDLVENWDIAKRKINGQDHLARSGAEAIPDSYAAVVESAVEHPALSGHNRQHERRVRLLAEALMYNTGAIRHLPHLEEYMPAAASFAQRHDRIQLIREHENLSKPNEAHLPPKYTHATGGAILELLEARLYAKASGVSYEDAMKVKKASAYMIMKHDKPALLDDALKGRKNAQNLPEGTDLLSAFDSNQLDLTTISPAQLIQIHIEKASQKKGFVTADTPYGLPKVVEDQYGDQLAVLARDTEPILPDVTTEQRKRNTLNVLTEVNVVADVMDMILPPEEALTRKFLVPINRDLAFFRPELSMDELIDQVNVDEGTQSEDVGSIATRALWEYAHALEMFPKGLVSDSPYARRIIGKAAIKGCLALQNIGKQILEGDDLNTEDSSINKVYLKRIKDLGKKAMRKSEIPQNIAAITNGIVVEFKPGPYEYELETVLSGSHTEISGRFLTKVQNLRTERDNVVSILEPKQKKEDGTAFSSNDIAKFVAFTEKVTETLCKRYGVTPAELKKYERELHLGMNDVPYKAYDGFAEPHKRRTLRATEPIAA